MLEQLRDRLRILLLLLSKFKQISSIPPELIKKQVSWWFQRGPKLINSLKFVWYQKWNSETNHCEFLSKFTQKCQKTFLMALWLFFAFYLNLNKIKILLPVALVSFKRWSSSPFSTNVPLLNPLKTSGFLMFSGGIEGKHWLKMG